MIGCEQLTAWSCDGFFILRDFAPARMLGRAIEIARASEGGIHPAGLLMHSSCDDDSNGIRAARVFHSAGHGTLDRTVGSPVNDWLQITPARWDAA